jgi:O-antigen ligase
MSETFEHSGKRSSLSENALAIALAFAWIAAAVAQRSLTAPLGAELGGALAAIPLFGWALTRHKMDMRRAVVLVIASLPVAAMLLAALLAPALEPALLGTPPLWQGWLLWATALGWLWITLSAADRSDLLGIARFLAVAGSVTAVWGLLERVAVVKTFDPTAAPVMAFFDNPQSLGQTLVITVAATAALAARNGLSSRARWVYGLLAALQLGAVAAAEARSALVAIALGVAAYGVLEERKDGWRRFVRPASIAVTTAFVSIFALVGAAWSGAFGRIGFERADHLLNGRLSIWAQAAASIAHHAWLGGGPARFEGFARWTALPDGRLDVWITRSAHSFLLAWLTDAGVIGFVLAALATLSLAVLVMRSARLAHSTHAARIMAAGLAAAFVAMLSSWPDPLAVLSATAVAGSFMSTLVFADNGQTRPLGRLSPVVLAPVSVACFAAAVSLWSVAPIASAEWSASHASSMPEAMSRLESIYSATHDITFLETELSLINSGPGERSRLQTVDLIRYLASEYPSEADDTIELPYYGVEMLWTHSDELSPDEYWQLTRFYAEKGRQADPSCGVWEYALARAALTVGRPDAASYVDHAIAVGIPAQAKDVLVGWGR